jgi:hypothetical protein
MLLAPGDRRLVVLRSIPQARRATLHIFTIREGKRIVALIAR